MILSKRSTLLLSIAGAGCAASQAPIASPALVTRDAHAAYEAAAAPAACASMGPFSCDFEPSSSEHLCDQLAKCLAAHDPAKANIQVTGCGELGTFETAPALSGVKRVAVVNVDGSLHGESGQGSYLVAEREGGFCLVDQAVRWESTGGGYLDTDSRLAWHTDNGKTLLSVRTQAVRFAESDEDEGDAVAGALCRDAEYALDAGRFVAVRERAVNEPCSDED
jgi:hypothetical protein